MSFFYKRPRGRRRANLQIHYPFNRAAYVRFRVRCWVEGRLDGARAVFRGAVVSFRSRVRGIRGGVIAATSYGQSVRPWLAARPEVMAPEAPSE